jgi:hypothetical protein
MVNRDYADQTGNRVSRRWEYHLGFRLLIREFWDIDVEMHYLADRSTDSARYGSPVQLPW